MKHIYSVFSGGVMSIMLLVFALMNFTFLLYRGLAYWAFSVGAVLGFGAWIAAGVDSVIAFSLLASFSLIGLTIFGIPSLRRNWLSSIAMPIFAKMLPNMGDTERIALEAGTVWWDQELFSGKPNWKKLFSFNIKPLNEKEKAFLAGPAQELCHMIDDWEVIQRGDLTPEIWAFIKTKGFLGMIIPEEFGGLGFSAYAHAQVISLLSSRCLTAGVTVMVPNSLGPAELLIRYGTEEQKNHYLPRLASGDDIPCFALTEPEAGSDAAATKSTGTICRGLYDGKEQLGMRLNWEKRYITLGPISTVIGLAFKLYDPDHLLGSKENLGITCALIPAHLPGINIGARHDPMGIPFQNGPNEGRDVFVPLSFIIGGPNKAGQGWQMLMESLGAGRGISLPSLAVAAAQLCTRIVGAYATVREQFNTPIGRFEGIEEPLARIGGLTYSMTAARRLTLGAIDAKEEPVVLTAIVKAYLTESMREVVNDAMDIRAGAGIVQGPQNILGRLYRAVPIGITVEGANILTRSLIIYGQGAIRCHPFVQKEMRAVKKKDLVAFDNAFWGHIAFVASNIMRVPVLGLLNSRLWYPNGPSNKSKFYLTELTRMSSAFALCSDLAMITLAGNLKRKESISGRLADVLAWMYIASATLKKFHDEGSRAQDEAVFCWSLEHALNNIEKALMGIVHNFPNRLIGWTLKFIIFPSAFRNSPPRDKVIVAVARSLIEGNRGRNTLTEDIYIPNSKEVGLGRLEVALEAAVAAMKVETKIRFAVSNGRLVKLPREQIVAAALEAGVINAEDIATLNKAKELQREVIQVDSFDPEIFKNMRG